MVQKADILIVDDEEDIRALIAGILEDEGYHVRQAGSAKAAFAEIDKACPDLAILDIWLQGSDMDGIQILEKMKGDHAWLPVLMISGHGNIETAVSAIKKGAYDFIEKPFKADRLILMIERALENASLRKENEDLRAKMHNDLPNSLSGTSEKIQTLQALIDKTAKANSRVLITGETGCGKNMVARLIHAGSERAEEGFDVLSAAALDPKTLDVTLRAAMERCADGTLVIDEIADMHPEVQARLVRILQDQKLPAADGSGAMIPFDVRVIATTASDIPARIAAKEFREDLYYRLNVVSVEVPPLRARLSDIPEIAGQFITKFSAPGQTITLDKMALALLERYKWPGNVRQLKNVIEGAMILKRADNSTIITKDDLPAEITGEKKNGAAESPTFSIDEMASLPLREAREHFERYYLAAQMERYDGSVARMANAIGMERSALHRKLKALDLSLDGKQDKDDEADGTVVALSSSRQSAG